ncbi:GNAT family N-acetyltransferase [Sutcliffiella cohnii]
MNKRQTEIVEEFTKIEGNLTTFRIYLTALENYLTTFQNYLTALENYLTTFQIYLTALENYLTTSQIYLTTSENYLTTVKIVRLFNLSTLIKERTIMEITPVVLTGDRVKIKPMEIHHVQELFEAGNNPSIWPYMSMNVQSMEDMNNLVTGALQARGQGSEFPFVIIDKDSGKIVGSTRFLNISIPNRNLEIGWTWLSPTVWRTRINTECKYLLLKHCFETLGTIRVQIKTDSRNVRSQQAIERIGGVKEGVHRNHMIMHDGYFRDTVFYSIIDKEWLQVKSNLESMLEL